MKNNSSIAMNRQAYHDYSIIERVEAGLVLTGTEIKSVRAGRVDIRGSYAKAQNSELWLFGVHIAPYDAAGQSNHDPKRPRKLLLHKFEIYSLVQTLSRKGLTLVPLRLYVKKHLAKVELGLAKGKRKYDKRRAIIERDMEREAGRALRRAV